MILIRVFVGLMFAMQIFGQSEDQVKPGSPIPRDIIEQVSPSLEETLRAMHAGDKESVRVAVSQSIERLGPWAGNPEVATRYYKPIDTSRTNVAKLREWWLKEIERGNRNLPWVKNSDANPRTMQTGLRETAYSLDGLARSANLFPERRDELMEQVRAGADWLVRLQRQNGLFPFPIGPGLNPSDKVGRIVARNIRAHPEILVDGWIVDDLLDGGLQFDNGLCGCALISAWEVTNDVRYLAAARKAGDWAIERPLVLNWNYNAFSVGLLARLATSTGEDKYLQAALTKARLGVLPGQLPTGRWFDSHNASAIYHNILLRELLKLVQALPQNHIDRPAIVDALVRGLDQAADETIRNGYSGTWTDNFAQGLQWLGESKKWQDSLYINLNASGKGNAPSPGIAAIAVLELYRLQP
jgi:hypothetical protein